MMWSILDLRFEVCWFIITQSNSEDDIYKSNNNSDNDANDNGDGNNSDAGHDGASHHGTDDDDNNDNGGQNDNENPNADDGDELRDDEDMGRFQGISLFLANSFN